LLYSSINNKLLNDLMIMVKLFHSHFKIQFYRNRINLNSNVKITLRSTWINYYPLIDCSQICDHYLTKFDYSFFRKIWLIFIEVLITNISLSSEKSAESVPYWNLVSLASTKNLSNSMVSGIWIQVLKNLI